MQTLQYWLHWAPKLHFSHTPVVYAIINIGCLLNIYKHDKFQQWQYYVFAENFHGEALDYICYINSFGFLIKIIKFIHTVLLTFWIMTIQTKVGTSYTARNTLTQYT